MANRSSGWLSRLVKTDRSPSKISPPNPNHRTTEDDVDTEARARRREQVRRAQRTHRDRRANYLKTLESEVARLRARDSAHEVEVQAYKQTIRRLKQLISDHAIRLPSDLATDPLIASPQATVELLSLPDHSQTIRAQLPGGYVDGFPSEMLSAPPLASESTVSSTEALASMHIAEASNLNQTVTVASANLISTPMAHPHGLGATQVGVDFVLALEQICLGHHGLHSCNTEGSGHTLMLTSPIMSRSPPLSETLQSGTGLADRIRWSVPAVELGRLLEFSDRLNLSGEVTPVEAWQRIRQHPNFPGMTRDGLEAVQAILAPEVQCHGFGAVIDEVFFDEVLQQALGPQGRKL